MYGLIVFVNSHVAFLRINWKVTFLKLEKNEVSFTFIMCDKEYGYIWGTKARVGMGENMPDTVLFSSGFVFK